MSDKVLTLTDQILNKYSQIIGEISEYLSVDDGFVSFYGNISKDEIANKLHEPTIRVDQTGGMLSYCKHELNNDHIIDLEFGGVLETFYEVAIDG